MTVRDVFRFRSISSKLMAIMGTIVLASFILVNLLALSKIEDNIVQDKRDMTRRLVQTNLNVLEHFYQKHQHGQLSEPEAKSLAVETIKNSFYGPGNKDYFWINDLDHVIVMHPYKPSLEGQDVSGVQDKKGNYLFRQMVDTVKEDGSGYVTYHWQYYDQDNRVEPKLSYVAGFEPWNWIVGTGVYINDVQQRVAAVRNNLLIMEGLALALILAAVYFLSRLIAAPVKSLKNSAMTIAEGDLDTAIDVNSRDEIGSLAGSLRSMVDHLKGMISKAENKTKEAEEKTAQAEQATQEAEQARQQAERAKEEGMQEAANHLSEIVERLSTASEEISSQIEEASQGSEEQKNRTNEVATAIEQMNASVLEISKNASQAAEGSENTKSKAEEGNRLMEQVVQAMNTVNTKAGGMRDSLNQLGEDVQGINRVMDVINDIADQTNLLALNAAIEAARAGEAGRGFAVVADEVRKLAEKTMQATQEVGQTITHIQSKTNQNVADMNEADSVVGETADLARQAGDSLEEIVSYAESNSGQVRNIATASEEQSSASEEINQSTEDINRTATEMADAMNQSAQAVSDLSQLAQQLNAIVEEMKQA